MSIDDELGTHEAFMQRALNQAKDAFEQDEVPVGAVVELNGRVIAAAHNQTIALKDATAHAEMLAITQAAQVVGDWRLEKCTLFVTLEPCVMCAGAIVNSRIPKVVFGAYDPKGGASGSLFNLLQDTKLNHQAEVVAGIMSAECGSILTDFFKRKRMTGKK